MSFVHLTAHSHFSLLDALGSPKALVKHAKEQGHDTLGLTDTSYVYGLTDFYKAAKAEEIKPIVGVEFYVAPGSRHDKSSSPDNKPHNLTLLAKDYQGYQNLLKLSTAASLEGFYYRPRIDFELLEQHHQGLVLLSGNRWGELAQAILVDSEEIQQKIIQKYHQLFQDDYYLEVQRHPNIPEYQQIESALISLSQKSGIPLVATQSSRYLNPQDTSAHDILVCIGTQTNITNSDRKVYPDDFSLKSAAEMQEIFSDLPEACANTLKIAEKCNVEIKFGQNLLPHFKTPDNKPADQYLKELCYRGLEEFYASEKQPEAKKQLDYELGIVNDMGFNDYFLIVWDFIHYAKTNGIAVGPGRGSAAGSIIAYTLKITELDPLQYGLIFERFLNPARVSMPDIDIDFADHRRNEVLDYTINKYGKDCVSQVITFGTMSAKAAIRDVGRAMGYPYSEVDTVAKAVPPTVLGKHSPLKVSKEASPDLSNLYKTNPRAKALIDNAINLEGTVRHAGTHACAVMVSDKPLVNYTALQRSTDGSDGTVTQYSMKPLEEIGLLKMDFLGLKNLSIIEKTINIIGKTKGVNIDITKIPIDDKQTFELLQRGETTGVFQLESSGMRRYIRELKPTEFEDIIAMISLYRPGPMEWIPQYIKGKHHPDTVKYPHKSLEEILKETYGVAIYQEQVMKISEIFSGFSLAEADILRKAVGKKIPELLAEQKQKFVDGAMQLGHSKDFATEIFEKVVEPFAGYGFNKSHAACYAMISYRTSYLKAHYPTEFMAALMTSDHGNTDKIVLEIRDCEEMGITVPPPSINESFGDFTAVEDGKIRFGLNAVKGIGEGPIDAIIDARKKHGKFQSLEELALNLPSKILNKKTIESLAYSGALDEFGERKMIAENSDTIARYAKDFNPDEKENQDQTDLFGAISEDISDLNFEPIKLKTVEPLKLMEKLKLEKDYLGLYVSGHPLKGLKHYLKRKVKLIESLTKKDVGKSFKLGGLLNSLKTVMTKSGKPMAYAELEDNTGKIPVVFFPGVYEKVKFSIQENQILIIEGKINQRNDELQLNASDLKTISLDTMINNAKEAGIYNLEEAGENLNQYEVFEDKVTINIPQNFGSEQFNNLKKFLESHPGQKQVILRVPEARSVKSLTTSLKIETNSETLQQLEKLLG